MQRTRLTKPLVIKRDDLRAFKKKLPRLTEETVLYLPTFTRSYYVWDRNSNGRSIKGDDPASGLGIHVHKTGAKTYRVIYYSAAGTQRGMKLGRVGEMTLAEARQKAREIRGSAAKGLNPRKASLKESDAFEDCLNEYIEDYQIGKKGNVSAEETRVMMLRLCDRWKRWPVATVTDTDIDRLLVEVRSRTPSTANRLHSHLSSFFRWAKKKKKRPDFPMEGIDEPWDGAKPRDFDWFRKDKADEVIKLLWTMASERGGDEERFVKLLLLTGKRRNAIECMRWEEIDKDWFWQPPPGSKTKRCTPIPLPKLAQQILGERQLQGRVMKVGRDGLDRLQALVRKGLGLDNFIWHGVRHIVETKLAELRIQPHVRDILLDHAVARSRSGALYDHHDYEPDMREALERWASYVQGLVKLP